MLNRNRVAFLAVCILAFIGTGCSTSGDNAASPAYPSDSYINEGQGDSQRALWGIWSIEFDPVSMALTYEPMRNSQMHVNVTDQLLPPMCDDCLTIEVIDFKPGIKYVELKAALKNETSLNGYDVRGILVSDAPGVKLLNADSHTRLWDDGGDVTINPFKAFATNQAMREFSPSSSHARIYQIEYPSFGELIQATLIVDASWPGNCKEPYEISGGLASASFVDYAPVDFQVEVFSWNDDVSMVTLDLRGVGYGNDVEMTSQGSNLWSVEGITWHNGPFIPGSHRILVTALTASSSIPLYGYIDVTVEDVPPTNGWARTWGPATPVDITTDSADNIYTAGYFLGTVDFDPGPGVDEQISTDNEFYYLTKLDPDGIYQWTVTWGGESLSFMKRPRISTDTGNNVYIVGSFLGPIDFDPGPGVAMHTSTDSSMGGPSRDVFLSKFDTDGSYLWTQTWGGPGENGNWCDVAADDSGNVFVSGEFTEEIDLDPGPGEDNRVAAGEEDIFFMCFDASGGLNWAHSWGGIRHDYQTCLAADNTGYVYISGTFRGIVDFDPGPGEDLQHKGGWDDMFIAKYDTSGNYLWARSWGGVPDEINNGLALDSAGNVYSIGQFTTEIDFDPGVGEDLQGPEEGIDGTFLNSLDPNGDHRWARVWIEDTRPTGIAISGMDNIFVTGIFSGTIDFDPGDGLAERWGNDLHDSYLSRFDSDGNHIWVRSWGGEHYSKASATTVDSAGDTLIAGAFRESVDFNPGTGSDVRVSPGEISSYISRIPSDGSW